jgi:RNA recognition motif-containing protein
MLPGILNPLRSGFQYAALPLLPPSTFFMNIHVSNLSLNLIDLDIRRLFAAFGEVSLAVIVRDRNNGRSRGHAFVEMPNHRQAEQAIVSLDGTVLDGKKMTVAEVKYTPGEHFN